MCTQIDIYIYISLHIYTYTYTYTDDLGEVEEEGSLDLVDVFSVRLSYHI